MKRLLLVLFVLLLFSSNALAAQWQLDAKSVVNPRLSDFSIIFNEKTVDGLFTIDEVDWCSGMWYDDQKLLLVHLPNGSVFTSSAGDVFQMSSPMDLPYPTNWQFSNDVKTFSPTNYFWSFTLTEIAATPIPGAVWLLGSGLVGLVGLRRKMRA